MLEKILLLFVLVTMSSCVDVNVENNEQNDELLDSFLSENEIGMIVEGQRVKSYDKLTEQIVFDDDKTIYSISNVSYTTHLTLSIEGDLILGNSVIVNYFSNNINDIDSGTISAKVVNIDSSTKCYWLWDSDLTTGIIIQYNL